MIADYPDAPPRLAPFLASWDYMSEKIWYVRDLYAASR